MTTSNLRQRFSADLPSIVRRAREAPHDAIARLEAYFTRTRSADFRRRILGWKAHVVLEAGQPDIAIPLLERAIDDAAAVEVLEDFNNRQALVRAFHATGRTADAVDYATLMLPRFLTEPYAQVPVLRFLAEHMPSGSGLDAARRAESALGQVAHEYGLDVASLPEALPARAAFIAERIDEELQGFSALNRSLHRAAAPPAMVALLTEYLDAGLHRASVFRARAEAERTALLHEAPLVDRYLARIAAIDDPTAKEAMLRRCCGRLQSPYLVSLLRDRAGAKKPEEPA